VQCKIKPQYAIVEKEKTMDLGDWVVARVNNDKTIEGTVVKMSAKTFWLRLQIAGQFRFIKRRYSDHIETVEF
jgi:hypothetical protein